MKTFDEKDLITWVNREKAVIGNEYYFGDSLNTIKNSIKTGNKTRLDDIINNTFICTFKNNCECYYSCILPVDAVKGHEKTYRACKTVKDFYELVSNSQCKMDEEECIYRLISDFIVHFRNKNTGTEYYSSIRSISKFEDVGIKILLAQKYYLSFNDIFNNYEVEINDKWQPFGVEVKNENNNTY